MGLEGQGATAPEGIGFIRRKSAAPRPWPAALPQQPFPATAPQQRIVARSRLTRFHRTDRPGAEISGPAWSGAARSGSAACRRCAGPASAPHPVPPSRLSTGVPSSRPMIHGAQRGPGHVEEHPASGATITRGAPLSNQCALHLAAGHHDGRLRAPATSAPVSRRSGRWHKAAAPTASWPAARRPTPRPVQCGAASAGSGPTPSGNRLSATMKNTSGSKRIDAPARGQSQVAQQHGQEERPHEANA
jgi:hypothetical protein